ncbi:hypothetical protein AIOGIFDO_01149 [Candidatus Methanoperedenaceae archaeon GB37]|mgnify:CR=1 FL=1|nr:hypothetical protein AIOGIFDO_01149 [Candidatus Methanoperedenaceae archaeon GB37]
MTPQKSIKDDNMDGLNSIEDPEKIALIEMGNSNFMLSCTPGKIGLWFGRLSTHDDVENVLQSISKIDLSAEHEKETICSFNEIAEYELKGYTVVSYARNRKGGYKAIFTIPLKNTSARAHFIETIMEELKESDVRKTLHWNGSIPKIRLIYNELKKTQNVEIFNIVERDENE